MKLPTDLSSEPDAFASRHPIIGAISLTIVFAVIVGTVAFGYVSALDRLGLNPRSDALAVVGVITDILLVSGIVIFYVQHTTVIEDRFQTLNGHTTRSNRDEATERENGEKVSESEGQALQQQTETLREGMTVLAEQQRVQRSLYTPSLEIDRFGATDSKDSPDTIRCAITNLSAGDATNLTIRSDVRLLDTPDGYSMNGTRATCPLTRAYSGRTSDRVPSRAEELGFETDVAIGITEETNGEDRTVACGFSDSLRVLKDDGVETIEISLELAYEDTFGDEYTEQIRRTRIDLTDEPTLNDVLRTDSYHGSSFVESANGRLQERPRITPSEH